MSKNVLHELQCWEIDELDELDDGGQCCSVWCKTCQRYEAWFLPLTVIGFTVTRTIAGPPNWKGYRTPSRSGGE